MDIEWTKENMKNDRLTAHRTLRSQYFRPAPFRRFLFRQSTCHWAHHAAGPRAANRRPLS